LITQDTTPAPAYGQLSVGVILQAVHDLKKALFIKANIKDKKELRRADDIIRDTTTFLRDTESPYHQMLKVDPQIFPELVESLIGEFATE